MNPAEFLALLDERLSEIPGDSRRYPTLDDYARAFDQLRAHAATPTRAQVGDRVAVKLRRVGIIGTPGGRGTAVLEHTHAIDAGGPLTADWFMAHGPATGWWAIQAVLSDGWHTIGEGRQFSTFTEVDAARRVVARMRQTQGHLRYRLYNQTTGEIVDP